MTRAAATLGDTVPDARVLTAGTRDRERLTAMWSRAFADDPAMSYIFPDPAERARRLPRLFRLLYDSDGKAGMRLMTVGGEAGTLWRAPGRVRTRRREMLAQLVPMVATFGAALPRALAVSDAIGAHMPAGAFWYLHVAGCDPAAQRRGLGAAAVRAGLTRAAGRLPCYLETATESNLGFYAGLGFRVSGEWSVPRDGPRFWSMLRPTD